MGIITIFQIRKRHRAFNKYHNLQHQIIAKNNYQLAEIVVEEIVLIEALWIRALFLSIIVPKSHHQEYLIINNHRNKKSNSLLHHWIDSRDNNNSWCNNKEAVLDKIAQQRKNQFKIRTFYLDNNQ